MVVEPGVDAKFAEFRGVVWAVARRLTRGPGALVAFDASTLAVLGRVAIPDGPVAVAAGSGALWSPETTRSIASTPTVAWYASA
jgi:hypothetical protein